MAMALLSNERVSPLEAIGGSDEVARHLSSAFPGVRFRVSEDAVGIFVFFTLNAPGAPTVVAVHDAMLRQYGAVFVKIPFMVDKALPSPSNAVLRQWRIDIAAARRRVGLGLE